MPSPLPGMDPWIDEHPAIFLDFHDKFLVHLCEQLNQTLPQNFFAKTNTIVWTEATQRREPDVGVFELGHTVAIGLQAVADLPSLLLLAQLDEPSEQLMIEIYLADDKRLVTAFELLSPANKHSGPARAAYLAKQREFRDSRVNLVEIDLLRNGLPTTLWPLTLHGATTSDLAAATYHVVVLDQRFGEQRLFGKLFSLNEPLPTIGIPLDEASAPALIEWQPLLNHCYDRNRYARQIDYSQPPVPPLSSEQQAWANTLLKEAQTGY